MKISNFKFQIRPRNFYVLLLVLIISIGIFFRFYNLNWGAPYYFHPDERNIAPLLAQDPFTKWPSYFFQGTFSYGNFPSLLLQIIKIPISSLNPSIDTFSLSIMLLRYSSALFSSLLLLLLFLSCLRFGKVAALISLILGAFSVGLIQNSHFGTFDIFITFWLFFSFYCCLLFIKGRNTTFFYLALLAIAIASSAKMTSIIFVIIIYISLLKVYLSSTNKARMLLKHFLLSIPFFLLPFALSPYYLNHDFFNLLQYEKGVVSGQIDVFYTQSFRNTIPFVYQFTHIFPFLINPILTIFFPFVFLYTLIRGIKTKNFIFLLTTISFLLVFIPQASLHAKWSRYMIPTLPFIYLMTSIALNDLLSRIKNEVIKKRISLYLLLSIFISSAFFGFLYSFVVLRYDTQIVSARWASQNIKHDAVILSEVYDMGIVPFNQYFDKITLFNFYDLDVDAAKQSELDELIRKSEYIIIPSQRVMDSRIKDKKLYPKGHVFYQRLLDNSLGFKKIYETPCDMFCKILYLNDPMFRYEQTANVFDRPTVMIFKKN